MCQQYSKTIHKIFSIYSKHSKYQYKFYKIWTYVIKCYTTEMCDSNEALF